MKLFLLLCLGWVGSCASNPSADKSVYVAVQKKSDTLASRPGGQPEPVYSTSFAIRLAELALEEQGFQKQGRLPRVSYMDGVYTIVFVRPPSQPLAPDFEVAIDARSSRILQITSR